jgi:hypothetical protein
MVCSSVNVHQLHILLGGSSLIKENGSPFLLGLLWTNSGVIKVTTMCGMGKCVVEAKVEGTCFVWYIYCDGEPLGCIRK